MFDAASFVVGWVEGPPFGGSDLVVLDMRGLDPFKLESCVANSAGYARTLLGHAMLTPYGRH